VSAVGRAGNSLSPVTNTSARPAKAPASISKSSRSRMVTSGGRVVREKTACFIVDMELKGLFVEEYYLFMRDCYIKPRNPLVWD